MTLTVAQNAIAEWAYTSGTAYDDPFNEVTLDVMVTDPRGQECRVPAFWGGGQTWRVRYASALPGTHLCRTTCSDTGNVDLHGVQIELVVTGEAHSDANPLGAHGRLRVAQDRRHLEHADGTPFFWLGDTWWMGLCRRMGWPADFQELAADRAAKGFSVVQIVAGLYPDMEPFDPRGANEAGFPWSRDLTQVNPAYWDMADLRIAHLVRTGLVPCIVGSWGYWLDYAGPAVLKRHWRHLVARYGAYPVVWCVAGEALMDYYLAAGHAEEAEERRYRLRAAWSDMVRTVRACDPFGNPVTIHPTRYGHDQVDDPALLDFDMLQTGHTGYTTLSNTVDMLVDSLAHEPIMPVLVSEVNYDGIMESSREEMQRFLFWTCMLSGAMGHTYGANGIWQVNTRRAPYGLSPHGTSWGNTPWEDAYQLPASAQLGMGKRFLERYRWYQLEPHPEWVEPHQTPGDRMQTYAAGVRGGIRVLYLPAAASWQAWRGALKVRQLLKDTSYRAFYWDPKTGQEHKVGIVQADEDGVYALPKPPVFQDWVFVLEERAE
jgi:hypothetical protein